MTPNEIAQSRPPDRITYSDWEPYFSDKPERRMVAERVVGVFVPTVTSWREVVDERPMKGMRRRRIEWWDPPRFEVAYDGDEMTFREAPPSPRVARYEWEYQP